MLQVQNTAVCFRASGKALLNFLHLAVTGPGLSVLFLPGPFTPHSIPSIPYGFLLSWSSSLFPCSTLWSSSDTNCIFLQCILIVLSTWSKSVMVLSIIKQTNKNLKALFLLKRLKTSRRKISTRCIFHTGQVTAGGLDLIFFNVVKIYRFIKLHELKRPFN